MSGTTVRAVRRPFEGLGAQNGPLAGLAGVVVLLAVLARTAGLGGAGWVVGLVCGSALNVALARALRRDPSARLGPADWVTLTRATLVVGAAALTGASFERPAAVTPLVMLSSLALALDFVDGWIARRTRTSALGAKLDGEVDAFLLLVLSVDVAPSVGAWVLAIGFMRYAFFATGWALPFMRAPLPRRDWRKTVTASQGVALVVGASGVVPAWVGRVLLAVALALLVESFGRDVWWLSRHRRHAPARATRARHPVEAVMRTMLAFAVVWAALVAPIKPSLLSPGSFARIPLEGLVVVGLALILPTRSRRLLAWLVGPLLGALVLIKVFDMGFFIAFDRPFNPVEDWSYLTIGAATVRDTFGSRDADLAVAAAVVVGVTALVVPVLAIGRLTQVVARHRGRSVRVAGALAAVWALCWALGAEVSGAGIASTSAAHLAVDEFHAVRADLRDQARFKARLARKDRALDTPPAQLLEGLHGKDVLLVFVESYGQMAVQGTSFSPSVDKVVEAGTRSLQADGFSSVSGWLTSSTYGGGSWLAHATLQSGTWINTPARYSELITSDRLTLASAFRSAGWRTVADVPATHGAWPEASSFYHYQKVWDLDNLVYKGPRYGFSTMPDEYGLQALQKLELAKPNRPPIFSEIDLTSSHEPWTRIPPLISWNKLGDGSIFKRLPIDKVGLTDTQQGYAQSIQYALRALYAFVERYGTKNTVLIVLGDHQPSRVTDPESHDVPTTIIAHDPTVIDRLSSWRWTQGMLPSSNAPVWPMSAFRDNFFNAFDH
jgi:phosphatidylglycerophosphate synthase